MKKQQRADVCLVMPPFADDMFPSLALGLLAACLSRAAISCRVDYAATYYLRHAGVHVGRFLTNLNNKFAAEAVFAPLAGIKPRLGLRDLAEAIEATLGRDYPAKDNLYCLEEARRVSGVWLEETIARILSYEPRFVGVCSMFQQRNAGLAVLKRLKEISPNIVTAMGGANCMGSAGGAMLSHFPFVDYVFFGEADEIFAEVVKGALSGKDFSLPYGVLRQGDPLPEDGNFPHRLTKDLDALPIPDFDDFFASRCHSLTESMNDYRPLLRKEEELVVLSMEGSRGCWWGALHPCSFCGLNGKMIEYRAKSPERMVKEMQALYEKYGHYGICLTDSILSREAQKRLPDFMEHFPLSPTSKDSLKPRIFCEIKSNLTEDEVKKLSEIGFAMLQPGIESLSDHLLELMGKGNTAIRHIALLKYAREYHVCIAWNFLYGFPGEETSDYEELFCLLPLLTHLPPPTGFYPLAYHRNSLYARNPEKYGLKLIPAKWYDFSSPEDRRYIEDIAYVYEDLNCEERKEHLLPLYDKMFTLVERWKLLAYGEDFADRLEMRDKGDMIEIMDLRECAVSIRHVLTGLEKEIYRLCRAPASREKILASLPEQAEKDVELCLKNLQEKKLLTGIREEYLALAVDAIR